MQTLTPSLQQSTSTAFLETAPGKIALSLTATAIVALAAHIAIPLPFTPIPLTLQPLAVLGVGLALGPVAGFAAMVAYLTEGVIGLPVFSPTGMGGVAQLLGPTGGFLMAYPFVAAIAGALSRRFTTNGRGSFVAALLACTSAMLFLFLSGAGWFHLITNLSLKATWSEAVLPFLPGESIKVLLAAGAYSTRKKSARI